MNFSLYRGKLHKVPDIPRRWPLSKPSMSLHVFQKAVAKRQEALHRSRHDGHGPPAGSEQPSRGSPPADHACVEGQVTWKSDHDDHVELGEEPVRKRKREDIEALETEENDCGERKPSACSEEDGQATASDFPDRLDHQRMVEPQESCLQSEDAKIAHRTDGTGDDMVVENEYNKEKEAERLEAPRTPAAKDEECIKPAERVTAGLDGCLISNGLKTEETSLSLWKAKKKAELEEKLKGLQETKHQLVQILKQVLISEEEAKRKAQGLPQYPTGGAMDQPTDQRIGSDVQLSGDLEEGELEYIHNHDLPVVGFNQGSHFSIAHPQPMGATPGRHDSRSQPLNKV